MHWNSFLKQWRKIGNAYANRQPPPPDMPGCHDFVRPGARKSERPVHSYERWTAFARQWWKIAVNASNPKTAWKPPQEIDLLLNQAPADFVVRSCGTKARYPTGEIATAMAVRRDLRGRCLLTGGAHDVLRRNQQ